MKMIMRGKTGFLLLLLLVLSGFPLKAGAEETQIRFVRMNQKSAGVFLEWRPVEHASEYIVTRTDAAPDGTITDKNVFLSSTEDPFFEDQKTGDSDAGIVYEYTVAAKDDLGKTVALGKTYIVKLSTISFTTCRSNGGTGAVLEWKKAPAASGYRVQWVRGSDFSSPDVRTKNLSANQLSMKILNLERGQRYSFRIQVKGKGRHNNNLDETVTSYSGTCTRSFVIPKKPKGKVVLHYNNGRIFRTVTVPEGSDFMLPAMDNPSGCTFMGWGKTQGIFMSQSRPVQLLYEAGQEITGLKGTTHLYAVLMRRNEEKDLTVEELSAPDTSSYKKIIVVGDSRTVRTRKTLNREGFDYRDKNVVFISKVGKGIAWFRDTAYKAVLSEIDKTDEMDRRPVAVVINLGINNVGHDPSLYANNYISFMNEIAPKLTDSNCRLFFVSVNPVNSVRAMKALDSNRSEWKVRLFNAKMKAGLSDEYTYINTYSWLMKTGYSTDAGAHGEDCGVDDGIHYTTRTYKRIFLRWMQVLAKKN